MTDAPKEQAVAVAAEISGDIKSIKCIVHNRELVKVHDGYRCPVCQKGIALTGNATIRIT